MKAKKKKEKKRKEKKRKEKKSCIAYICSFLRVPQSKPFGSVADVVVPKPFAHAGRCLMVISEKEEACKTYRHFTEKERKKEKELKKKRRKKRGEKPTFSIPISKNRALLASKSPIQERQFLVE